MRKEKRFVARLSLIMSVTALLFSGCSDSKEIDPAKYVELGQYKGLDVKKEVHEVTDEEMQDELDTLASAYSTTEELTEGMVEEGDIANIDYEGRLNGVAFDGGTAQGYDLAIGSGSFIDGFEDGLVGVEIGETVELPLTFPENYGKSDLAGQDVVFTVTVNSVSRPDIPELTDDFINEISQGQYQDLDSYKEALEEQIISEYEGYNELQYYTDLLGAAVDNATIIKEIPADYINEKVSRMVVNSQSMAKAYNLSFSDFLDQYMGITEDEFYTQAADYARLAAKQSLVLQLIAREEGISVSEEELNKAIDEYVVAGNYESREDFLAQTNLDDLEEYVLTSKVEDFLAANAANNN